MLQNLKSQGSLQMLKSAWESLSPSVKNVINEVGFGTFFEACQIMKHMSTRIFSYFLPEQNASGTLPVPSIFQTLGR